jgi:hypothetical protein
MSSPYAGLNVNPLSGNVGIGTSAFANKLSVLGNVGIGASYVNVSAPPNGLIVQSNVGIGTTNPAYELDVVGNINFTGDLFTNGTPFIGNGGSQFTSSETNVTIIDSNVGIGLTNPGSHLAVSSNVSIGSTYSLLSAPSNSLIVQEAIGIGKTNPTTALDVVGTTRTDSLVTSSLQADTNGTLSIGTTATQIDIGTSTTLSTLNIATVAGSATTINLGVDGDNIFFGGILTGSNLTLSSNLSASALIASNSTFLQNVSASNVLTSNVNALSNITYGGMLTGSNLTTINNVSASRLIASNSTLIGGLSAGSVTTSNISVLSDITYNGMLLGSNLTTINNVSASRLIASNSTFLQNVSASTVMTSNVNALTNITYNGILTGSNLTMLQNVSASTVMTSNVNALTNITYNGMLTGSNVTTINNVSASRLIASNSTLIGGLSAGSISASNVNALTNITYNGMLIGSNLTMIQNVSAGSITSSNATVLSNAVFGSNIQMTSNGIRSNAVMVTDVNRNIVTTSFLTVDVGSSRLGVGVTNPSTALDVGSGTVTASIFSGNLTGNVTGNLTGTVNTGTQGNITSLGTLTSLTVRPTTNSLNTFSVSNQINTGIFVVDTTNSRVGINSVNPTTALDVGSGTVRAGTFSGNLTGNVTGNLTGTVTTATQGNITALGILTGLTVKPTTNDTTTFLVQDNLNNNVLVVDTLNNQVGINTDSVSDSTIYKLDVNGSTRISGNLETTAFGANNIQVSRLSKPSSTDSKIYLDWQDLPASGNISSWNDFSQATSSRQPTVSSAEGVNILKSAQFTRSATDLTQSIENNTSKTFNINTNRGFTFACLVRPEGTAASYEHIFNCIAGTTIGTIGDIQFLRELTSTRVQIYVRNTGNGEVLNYVSANNVLEQNTWKVIVFKYDINDTTRNANGSMYLYVNNVLEITPTTQNYTSIPANRTITRVIVGDSRDFGIGGDPQFNGKIGGLYFYDKPLSSTEINYLYDYLSISSSYKLDVYGSTRTSYMSVNPPSGGAAKYHLHNGLSVAEWTMGQKSSSDHSFKLTRVIGGVESDVITVNTNNQVGINTDPGHALDVSGSINFTGSLLQNGNNFNPGSQFTTSGTRVYLPSGSNLGIGTATPDNPLDVIGTARAGNVVVTGIATATHILATNSSKQLISTNISQSTLETKLGYVDVSSSINNALNAKLNTSGGTITGSLTLSPTLGNYVLATDTQKNIVEINVPSVTLETKLGYVDTGASINTALNTKLNTSGGSLTGNLSTTGTVGISTTNTAALTVGNGTQTSLTVNTSANTVTAKDLIISNKTSAGYLFTDSSGKVSSGAMTSTATPDTAVLRNSAGVVFAKMPYWIMTRSSSATDTGYPKNILYLFDVRNIFGIEFKETVTGNGDYRVYILHSGIYYVSFTSRSKFAQTSVISIFKNNGDFLLGAYKSGNTLSEGYISTSTIVQMNAGETLYASIGSGDMYIDSTINFLGYMISAL